LIENVNRQCVYCYLGEFGNLLAFLVATRTDTPAVPYSGTYVLRTHTCGRAWFFDVFGAFLLKSNTMH